MHCAKIETALVLVWWLAAAAGSPPRAIGASSWHNVTTACCTFLTDDEETILEANGLGLTRIETPDVNRFPNLTNFWFDDNRIQHPDLEALGHFTKLSELRFRNNSIQELPDFHIKLLELTEIDFSENKITSLNRSDTFDGSRDLKVIHLSINLIENIDENIFKPLLYLKTVYLDFNKIRYLPERLFVENRYLLMLIINDNLIEYLPERIFANNPYLTHLNIHRNRLSQMPDGFLSNLARQTGTVNLVLFENPWQCACLNKIVVQAKKLGIYYHIHPLDKADAPVCIMSYPFRCIKHNEYPELKFPTSEPGKLHRYEWVD